MRKRRLHLILAGVGVLVGVLVFGALRGREPKYGGKRLSEWANEYTEGLGNAARTNDTQLAAKAICQIGTKAIPYLAEWIEYCDVGSSPVTRALDQVLDRKYPDVPKSFGHRMPARAWDALHAFIALDNGMGGAEEISRLSVYRKQRWLNISTNNLSTWDRVLTNHNQSIDLQLIAGFEIGLMGSNASSAAPIFEVFLTDPDLNVRMAGTNALRRIRKGTPINTPL